MSALKAHEVEAFLRRGAKDVRFFLVYGPDAGLVNERCALLARDAEPVKLEGDEVADDPGKLIDEAQSIGLFGGERVIWLREGKKQFHDAIAMLLENPPPDMTLIVEAGDLKPSSALRKLFEGAKNAITLPCYGDDARALFGLIDEELSAAGLIIDAEAKRALIENLGGDRQASRQELKKLCLYAHGHKIITLEDVLAVTGDVSALAFDHIFDELGLGQNEHVLEQTQRHLAHGTPGAVLLNMAMRHMMMLQLLRFEVDSGHTTSEAVKSASRPIFFKRQSTIERQLVLWSLPKIDHALEVLSDAVLKTRQLPHIANALSERALMDVAGMARGEARRA